MTFFIFDIHCIEMHSKYDNMLEKHMNGSLKCINNHIITSKYSLKCTCLNDVREY